MDMGKDEPLVYVPMQEQIDTIKYADIQPSPYESPYEQDVYQDQGSVWAPCVLPSLISSPMLSMKNIMGNSNTVIISGLDGLDAQ